MPKATDDHNTSIVRVSRPLSRRLVLGTSSAAAVAASVPVAMAAASSDAKLMQLCDAHAGLIEAVNNGPDACLVDDSPLWAAYARSRDAISAFKPTTLAGMYAKARAAKAEAQSFEDGSEDPESTPAARWAWDLLNDLLRIREGRA